MKPKRSLLRILLLAVLALASIFVVVAAAGLFMFAAATSMGTAQDEAHGMKVAGVCLAVASGIIVGWIAYGLRGAWRVVIAAPFALLFCLGLGWILSA